MGAVLAIAESVVADAVRRKVVWVVLVFSAVLAFAVPSLPSYGDEVVAAVFREVTIALMFTAALVVGLALAATRIPSEIERRTLFNILARNVERWQYIVGTWIGMFLTTALVLASFTAVALVMGYLTYQSVMLVLLQATLAVWFEAGVVMALAVLVSTRFAPVTTLIAAIAFLFVGHSIGGLLYPVAHGSVSAQPWWFPSLDVFNVVSLVAHGSGISLAYVAAMAVVFAAWVGLLMVAASASFKGRDL